MVGKGIKRGEGFLWLAVGGFICFVAGRTGIGVVKEPGPGFIALAAGLFMVGVGVIMILTALVATGPIRDKARPGRLLGLVSSARVIYTLGLLFVYAFLLGRLGHILTTVLVMWGLFYDWEKKNYAVSLLLSVLVAGISYLFFEKLLMVQFPRGVWP